MKKGWIDRWRDATVALGRTFRAEVKEPGKKAVKRNFFVVVGTGVIFGMPNDPTNTSWLVTAKHVFCDLADDWDPPHLYLRFSWFDERPVDTYQGIRVELKRGDRHRWVSHPNENVDLACLPLVLDHKKTGQDPLPRISLQDIGTTQDIYPGVPIILLGYPDAVAPDLRTRALLRQGIVSWVSSTKPESNLFWVDSRVFPGNSGGPVFKLPPTSPSSGRVIRGSAVPFLGIVTQARIHQLPLLASGKEIELRFGKKRPSEPLFSQSYIGLALVEPAIRVKQLLLAARKSVTRH